MNKNIRKRKADDMRNILSCISRDLRSNDADGLKFLLVGTLNKPFLTKDVSTLAVFNALEENDLLSEESPWLLIQCLTKISRSDLVHKFFSDILGMEPSFPAGEISQYRLTLFDIGVELGDTDKDYLTDLFKECIPKSTRERMRTPFDLLIFLEETNAYHQKDTGKLERALHNIGRKDLAKKLRKISPSASKGSRSGSGDRESRCTFEICLKDSVIKGIHVYEVIPPLMDPPIRLHVRPEAENPLDENACLVTAPKIEEITGFLKAVLENTDYCSEVAGEVIGSVPWGLSKTFRLILSMGCDIYAEVTEEPCESFPPWPERFEKGGGVVIPCDFRIACPNEDTQHKAKKAIKYALKTMPEKDAMTLC